MKDLELICFKIISQVGEAKSSYLQALKLVKEQKFEEASKLMEQGENAFLEGHHTHAELIQKEACGDRVDVSLLLLHAEDQLMAAEIIKILVDELMELHGKDKEEE